MPITFGCPCGKTLKVADEHAGRRVKCPACNGLATVPVPQPAVVAAPPPLARAVTVPPKPPVPNREPEPASDSFEVAGDDEPSRRKSVRSDDDRPSRRRSSRRDDDDDEENEREARRRRRRSRNSTKTLKRALYIGGGLLAVLIGLPLAYSLWHSREGYSRGMGRAIAIAVLLIVGGLGAIVNGLTGNVGDD